MTAIDIKRQCIEKMLRFASASRVPPTKSMKFCSILVTTASALSAVLAHGGHHTEQEPLSADATWAEKHMREEHHVTTFDAGSFFKLHDFDGTDVWTYGDISKMYGLGHPSLSHISQEEKDAAIKRIIELYDRDLSGTVSYPEYIIGEAQGTILPDLGLGPGHHGDDEYEYEIHHFEKYHGADAKLEDLTHPEDIEHFQMHEQQEQAAERLEQLDRMAIVEANIPRKFRRGG